MICCCLSVTIAAIAAFVQVGKLAGIIKEKDASLESYKSQEKEIKRVERNTAALIAASSNSEGFAALAERIQAMVRLFDLRDFVPRC